MLKQGMKVRCYYNLTKHCISVQYKGKVIAHVSDIALEDVTFVVQQGGRDRVLREKRKNVHAFVQGTFVERTLIEGAIENLWWKRASYSPYVSNSFYDTETRNPCLTAKIVYITDNIVWYS